MAGMSSMDGAGRRGDSRGDSLGNSNRKSTSASGRRAVCDTVCVPGGKGFAEFHSTSDSHASSSARKIILAPRASRDAPLAATAGRSGASGGMAAWNLTRQGIHVLMLDAGVKYDRATFWSHVKPWEAEDKLARGQRPPEFYVDVKEQPYATLKNQPFDLVRVWGRGGKTNVWGRVSLRYSDVDFTNPVRDGWEIPWPIRYKNIAPYYDKVDQFIGVCGGDDDQDSLPGSRFHLPPPPPRSTSQFPASVLPWRPSRGSSRHAEPAIRHAWDPCTAPSR